MNISGIASGVPAADSAGALQGAGKSPQLSALEQKLQRLTNEKKQAVRNQDKEKEKKLEQEIQAVKQQIEQLKRKEKKKEQEKASENTVSPDIPSRIPGLGDRVDQYA